MEVRPGERLSVDMRLAPSAISLAGVQVVSSGIDRVKGSAYNAVAIDARQLHNSTKSLAEALQKAPGLKLREAGGVGSDINVMVDGFSGKHVKVFIDGVPQEGVGSSFGLGNIPVTYAERIEVYKGVVPVGLGADAIGGVINIVTNKRPRRWHADASYSYGSFNTHRSHVDFGQSFRSGLTYEVTAFQNYSDNDYRVDAPIYDFETNSLNARKLESVRRFNDTYHNEAVMSKVGVTGKPWADRLMVGFGYSHMYKEIQTGVRQKTVFGQKHRHGHSLMPSVEYSKRNLFVKGLSAVATLNYNRSTTTNVDTASYDYNWRGESRLPRLQANNRKPRHAQGKLGASRQHPRHRHLHLPSRHGPPARGKALRRRRPQGQAEGVDILGARRLVWRPRHARAVVRGGPIGRAAAPHGLLPVVQAHPQASQAWHQAARHHLNGPIAKQAVSQGKTGRFANPLSLSGLLPMLFCR